MHAWIRNGCRMDSEWIHTWVYTWIRNGLMHGFKMDSEWIHTMRRAGTRLYKRFPKLAVRVLCWDIFLFLPYMAPGGQMVGGKILTTIVGTICPPGKPHSENCFFKQFLRTIWVYGGISGYIRVYPTPYTQQVYQVYILESRTINHHKLMGV